MHPSSRGSSFAWLGPTLGWGIPLGLLQVGILLEGVFVPITHFGWTPGVALGAAALGALCYLVIPAIAGFFTVRRHGDVALTGGSVGWKMGACSLLVVSLFALVMVVANLISPPQAASGAIGRGMSPLGMALVLGTFFLAVIVLNSFGLLLGFVGGCFGGWLGRRTISPVR